MASVTEGYTDRTDYTYDGAGRLVSAVRPNGEFYHYAYDAAGNLISEARGEYGKDGTFKVSETTYDVDAAGQIVTSTRTGGKGPIVTSYEYDANGRLVYTEGPRGDEEDLEDEEQGTEGKPDKVDESSIGDGVGGSHGKGADKGSVAGGEPAADPQGQTAEGQITDEEPEEDEWVTTEYTYDPAGRLVEVHQDAGPNSERYVAFTYDGDGNRVGLEAHVEVPGDNGKHLGWYKADKVKDGDLPGNGGGNGNAGGNGNGNAGRNGNGNGHDGGGSANLPPGQAKKDALDGSKGKGKGQDKGGKSESRGRSGEDHGKGKAKGHDKSNKNKVYDLELSYVNDILAPVPEVLATYDGQGQPRDSFVYGLQRLAGIGPDGQSTVYVYDGLGSVRQLADAQGSVFDRYTYSPYGLPTTNGRLNPSHRLNDGNTFGFGGQDHDPVFGLVYLRARYYTPALGRFTVPDPLVMAGVDLPTLSPYVYGRNNPLRFGDPSGLTGQTNNSVYVPGKTNGPKDMAFGIMFGSGVTEGFSSDWQLGPALVSGAVAGVKSGLNFARQAGKAGEDAFAEQFPGFVRNTKKFTTEFGNVIPDYSSEGALAEVKNAKTVALTKQLKGEIAATKEVGKQYILAIREGYTRLTSGVTKYLTQAGGAVVYYTLKATDILKDVGGKIGPGIEAFPFFMLDSPELRKFWDPFYSGGTT